jgi:hypothetical protein
MIISENYFLPFRAIVVVQFYVEIQNNPTNHGQCLASRHSVTDVERKISLEYTQKSQIILILSGRSLIVMVFARITQITRIKIK